jgi:hypothetical protein
MWFLRFSWADASALTLGPDLSLYRSEDGIEGCAYVRGARPQVAGGVTLVRLHPLQEVPGAAFGRDAPWHYIVATDVLAGHDDDLNAWYRDEHLAGLAAVPGTVRAARYEVVDGTGPRYHACYDLAERSAFNSPPWLAVRNTAWSDRVRPHFFNTRRTMYRRVEPGSG